MVICCYVGWRTASWIHIWPYQWHTGQGRGKRSSGHAGGTAETWGVKHLYRFAGIYLFSMYRLVPIFILIPYHYSVLILLFLLGRCSSRKP